MVAAGADVAPAHSSHSRREIFEDLLSFFPACMMSGPSQEGISEIAL
jgi:hypothetical protein